LSASLKRLPDDADSVVLAAAIDARRSTLGRLQILRDALIKAELALDHTWTEEEIAQFEQRHPMKTYT
jgi:hypothetical protein